MIPGAPAFLRRVLACTLPPGPVRDGLLGDLDELYEERAFRGRVRANIWYARQLVSAAVRYPPQRLWAMWTQGKDMGTVTNGLGRDLGYAFRMVRRRPGFAAVIVATFALGIGANTAVFSAVDSILLRPLPYAHADRLAALWLESKGASVGPATYAAVRERSRTMEEVAAWSGWSFAVTGDGEAEVIEGARVTTNLLGMLGAVPLHGRTFVEEEALPWAGPAYAGGSAVVLSYGLWQRRYGGDPDIVGRTIAIDGMAVPVVGVLPQSFDFPSPRAELWLPVAVDPSGVPSGGGAYRLIGRLQEGVSPEDALTEARELARALRVEHPDRFPARYGEQTELLALRDDLVGPTKQTLLILFGSVSFVLLVACANLANLFMARVTGRRTEMSIRKGLGADRWRLVRQLLTEYMVLAFLGALLGLALAYGGARVFASALPPDLSGTAEIGVNGRVLAFTVGLTALAGLLSGIAPAVRTARGELKLALAEAGRGSGVGRDRHRLLESLVVAELAIALVLVVGAGLMLQSFWRLSQQDLGFQPAGVLTFRASAPEAFYPEAQQSERLIANILEQVGALPGVVSAGAIHLLPLGGSNWGDALEVESQPLPPGQDGPTVAWRVATPEYFRTVGVPLLAGRGFTEADRRDTPAVAVINQTLARQVFRGEDPLGRRVRTGFEGEQWATIVGVVGDTKELDLASVTRPQIYRPHAQEAMEGMTYMIRTEGNPLALARASREVVARLDANVPVSEVQPLEDVVAQSIAEPRLLTFLLAGFGSVGLLLAALGIYGVISYAVSQRTREFGIRLALGARPADVRRQVIRGGGKLAVLGLLIGIAGSGLLVRFLESALYEVEPHDAPTFAAVAVLLGGVALLGSYLPARRAGRVDPMTSLGEG